MFKIGDKVKLINNNLTLGWAHPLLNTNEIYTIIQFQYDSENSPNFALKNSKDLIIHNGNRNRLWWNQPKDFILYNPKHNLNDIKSFITKLESSLWPPR